MKKLIAKAFKQDKSDIYKLRSHMKAGTFEAIYGIGAPIFKATQTNEYVIRSNHSDTNFDLNGLIRT